MIRIPFSKAALLPILLVMGCTSTERLNHRIGLLEKEVADLHGANRRMDKRLDEMQIQLSLLRKKLAGPSMRNQGESPGIPALKVFRLHPEKKAEARTPPASGGRRLVAGGPVDPDKVSERLEVDLDAARRPLLEPEPEGEDEDTIARRFAQACSFYNAAEYTSAVSALNHFINTHPEHPLAIDALHLVGEAKLVMGRIAEAQRTFNTLAEQHPKSERAVSALLMVGECEEKLGQVKQARSTYLQLVEAYPLSREAAEANRRLQAMR